LVTAIISGPVKPYCGKPLTNNEYNHATEEFRVKAEQEYKEQQRKDRSEFEDQIKREEKKHQTEIDNQRKIHNENAHVGETGAQS
jgi:hypothetical protein